MYNQYRKKRGQDCDILLDLLKSCLDECKGGHGNDACHERHEQEPDMYEDCQEGEHRWYKHQDDDDGCNKPHKKHLSYPPQHYKSQSMSPPALCQSCSTEVLVDGVLCLPCAKPPIHAICHFTPVCRITDWHWVCTDHGRKVVVSGEIKVTIQYVTCEPEHSTHQAHFIVPFHTFFFCNKPLRNVVCKIEDCQYQLVNRRTISLAVLLGVTGVQKHHSDC